MVWKCENPNVAWKHPLAAQATAARVEMACLAKMGQIASVLKCLLLQPGRIRWSLLENDHHIVAAQADRLFRRARQIIVAAPAFRVAYTIEFERNLFLLASDMFKEETICLCPGRKLAPILALLF